MIRFRCPCGRLLQAREEDVGESARCPVCAAVVLVPTEQEAMRDAFTRTPTAPVPAAAPARRSGHGWREVEDDRPAPSWRDRDRGDRRTDEPQRSSRKARWALTLGVLSSFLCALGPFAGLAAVILGVMGRREVARHPGELTGRSKATAGLLMGLLGLIVSTGTTLVAWPNLLSLGDGDARAQNSRDLKQLAQAMRNHDAGLGHLPEAAVYAEDDRPLLSWRVALLPYIGEHALYQQFKLDEPWDGPNNIRLLTRMPKVYQLPGRATTDGSTYIQVLTGPGAVFQAPLDVGRDGGRRRTRLGDITDGSSNTILIAVADRAVPWTSPQDMSYSPSGMLPAFSRRFRGGHNVAMADGTVRWLKHSTSRRTVHGLITPSGGEFVFPGDD